MQSRQHQGFSIRRRIALLDLVLFVFGALAIGLIQVTMDSSANDINVAGRQRMLSQRLAKEALMVAAGVESKQTLASTIDLFERSHQALLQGDPHQGIHAARDPGLRHQLEKVGTLWRRYRKAIETYVTTPDTQSLRRIHDLAPVVLKEMNKAVVTMAGLSRQASFAQAHRAQWLIGGILLIAAAVLWVNLGMLRKLDRLRDAMSRVEQEQDLSLRLPVKGNDELAQLAASYNRLMDRFVSMLTGVIHSALAAGTDAAEMNHAEERMIAEVRRQAGEIDQLSSAMNEMSASIQEVATNIQHAAEAAEAARGEATQGHEVMARTVRSIEQLNVRVAEAADVIADLGEHSREIGQVLEVINSIAEQTNLLALNAAIEAARAGEHGRGFAVVADEVRMLASRTQSSTQEIEAMIGRVRDGIDNAVQAMDAGRREADEGRRQAAEADSALERIRGAVSTITDMNLQVASAAEEQSQVAEEINRNVVAIAELAQHSTTSAESALAGTRRISNRVDKLQQQAARFRLQDDILELEQAKAAHLSWRTRVRNYLDNGQGLSRDEALSHEHCQFGRWYYGPAREALAGLAEYQALDVPHRTLHQSVARILDLREQGQNEQAEREYENLLELSSRLVEQLDQLQACLANTRNPNRATA